DVMHSSVAVRADAGLSTGCEFAVNADLGPASRGTNGLDLSRTKAPLSRLVYYLGWPPHYPASRRQLPVGRTARQRNGLAPLEPAKPASGRDHGYRPVLSPPTLPPTQARPPAAPAGTDPGDRRRGYPRPRPHAVQHRRRAL